MSRTGRAAAALLAVAGLAFTAACGEPPASGADKKVGADLDELVKLAKQEGELNYYGSANPALLDVAVPAFEKKYGIKVNLTRLNSAELGQRFLAENTSSPADVVEVPDALFATEPDLFAKLDANQIPGWDDYPEAARPSDRTVTTYVVPWAILWNTDLVPEGQEPTSWEDVTDPKWTGKFLLTDPRSSDSYMGWADTMATTYGIDFLQKIGSGSPPLASSGAAGIQQVAAGEYALGFMHYAGNILPFKEKGAPVDYRILDDPPMVLPMNMGVPVNAPNPNAARLFAYFRMSEEAQKLECDASPQGSPLSPDGEIESCLKLPPGWQPYNSNLPEDRRNELLDALSIKD